MVSAQRERLTKAMAEVANSNTKGVVFSRGNVGIKNLVRNQVSELFLRMGRSHGEMPWLFEFCFSLVLVSVFFCLYLRSLRRGLKWLSRFACCSSR